MIDNVKIFFPNGAFGASERDTPLDVMLRDIARAIDPKDKHWSSKYGANYKNKTFMMHVYCWCGEDNCPWCNNEINFPNFLYEGKKLGPKNHNLAVWWYKYIGRGTKASMKLSKKIIDEVKRDCIESIKFDRSAGRFDDALNYSLVLK